MRVMVSGAGGLVGRALCAELERDGHAVAVLARGGAAGPNRVVWNPEAGFAAGAERALAGCDAVVHLAGEPIAGLWTAAKRERIRASRVVGSRHLAQALASLEQPPRVWVCASGVGIYGDRGTERLTETSVRGSGFLADVVEAWEAATAPAAAAGVRVVNLRLGAVLSARGGMLKSLLLPFRLGLGGRLGSGEQRLSWVAIDDLVEVVKHAIATPGLHGPVNVAAPGVVSNREFTAALARVLRRPVGPPAPAWLLRAVLGDLARELLLASVHAVPAALDATGFRFAHPELEPALRHLLA